MKSSKGMALFLDRSDINTDEVIFSISGFNADLVTAGGSVD